MDDAALVARANCNVAAPPQQVEELIALSAIFGADLRLLSSAPNSQSLDSEPGARSEGQGTSLDALLEPGAPPLEAPVTFEVLVHVAVPDGGLTVGIGTGSLCGSAAGEVGLSTASAGPTAPATVDTGITVTHLPPLRVRITLPLTYPDGAPPVVQLSAPLWLQPHQAARLQGALEEQWWATGAAGQPVCFAWLDYLSNQALEEIGIAQAGHMVLPDDTHIEAAPADVKPGPAEEGASRRPASADGAGAEHADLLVRVEPAAGASSSSGVKEQQQLPAGVAAVALARYSAGREAALFQSRPVCCPVCFDDLLGSQCVRLDCGHFACRSCFSTYASTQVRDGAVEAIRCMDTACRAQVPPSVLCHLLSADDFERFEELLLQRTLDKMQDVCYCPRCQAICVADEEKCARCPTCLLVFCADCKDGWHPGRECVRPEEALRDKQGELARAGHADDPERQRRIQELRNQYKSHLMVLATTKPCPGCRIPIQKTEGCNKVTCSTCYTSFCFKCGQRVNDYSHFGQSCWETSTHEMAARSAEADARAQRQRQPEPDVNNLHHLANNPLEAAMLARMARQDPRARLHHVVFSACPRCKQPNLKERNNLLRCAACHVHYCAACTTVLTKRPGLHFGPSKCRQHSDD